MLAHSPLTVSKKKKQKIDPIPAKKAIVVCPNCKFHFKYTMPDEPNYSNLPITDPRYSREHFGKSGLSYSLAESPQKQLEVAQRDVPSSMELSNKKEEQQLIVEINNKNMKKIQKLQKLTDLSLLKKSRLSILLQQEQIDPLHQSDIRYEAFESIQPVEPVSHSKGKQIASKRSQAVSKSFMQQYKSPEKMSPSLEKELSIKGQAKQYILEQTSTNYQIRLLVYFLLQWLQSTQKMCLLPYHLKMLVEQYYDHSKQNH